MFHSFKASGDSPLYTQLAEYIKRQIEKSEIHAGERLPSVRQMASETGLSKNTVSSAVAQLEAEGYISIEEKKRPVVLWRKSTMNSPDWYDYLNKSRHMPTANTYQAVSTKRGRSNLINAYEVRLGQDFYPGELMQKVLNKVSLRVKDIYHQSYFDLKGISWVREAVCQHLRRYNIHADSSQVLMSQGPLNSMDMITQGLLGHGMKVFLPVPNTLSHLKIFNSSGFNVVGIPQDEEGIRPDILDSKTRGAKGILHVNTVSYWPNSATMSEKRIKEVLEVCVKNKIPVMESDMMREYGAEAPPAMPMKSYDTTGNVIYICTFTRPLIPGLRVSAIVGPEIVINKLSDIRLQTDWAMDSVSQLIMGELIASGLLYEYTDQLRPLLAERLEKADALMHRYFDGLATWEKNRYGLNFWLVFDKSVDTSRLDTASSGILISPGSIYGEEYKHCLWLCYAGVSLNEFEQILSVISNAVYNLRVSD